MREIAAWKVDLEDSDACSTIQFVDHVEVLACRVPEKLEKGQIQYVRAPLFSH